MNDKAVKCDRILVTKGVKAAGGTDFNSTSDDKLVRLIIKFFQWYCTPDILQ